jgi:hypothetical protein
MVLGIWYHEKETPAMGFLNRRGEMEKGFDDFEMMPEVRDAAAIMAVTARLTEAQRMYLRGVAAGFSMSNRIGALEKDRPRKEGA